MSFDDAMISIADICWDTGPCKYQNRLPDFEFSLIKVQSFYGYPKSLFMLGHSAQGWRLDLFFIAIA